MLAKHKVVSSTLLTRSTFKPLILQRLFLFCKGREELCELSRYPSFDLVLTFHDRSLDQIHAIVDVRQVLRIVSFEGFLTVAGLSGNKGQFVAARQHEARVAVAGVVEGPRPDLELTERWKPFALVEIALIDRHSFYRSESVCPRVQHKSEVTF